MTFFESVQNGVYTVSDVLNAIPNFFKDFFAAEHVSSIKDTLFSIQSPLAGARPYIFIAFFILLACMGKRMIPLMRFVVFFLAGFFASAFWLAPLIPQVAPAIIGLAVGFVSAVLSKLFYYLALALIPGYMIYTLGYAGSIPVLEGMTKGNMTGALVPAIIVVVLGFILLKLVEPLGTALLGGWGIANTLYELWDYKSLEMFNGIEWVPTLIIISLVGFIGFLVQFKYRKRY